MQHLLIWQTTLDIYVYASTVVLALVQFLVSVYVGCIEIVLFSFVLSGLFSALDTCFVEYEVQGVVLCVE